MVRPDRGRGWPRPAEARPSDGPGDGDPGLVVGGGHFVDRQRLGDATRQVGRHQQGEALVEEAPARRRSMRGWPATTQETPSSAAMSGEGSGIGCIGDQGGVAGQAPDRGGAPVLGAPGVAVHAEGGQVRFGQQDAPGALADFAFGVECDPHLLVGRVPVAAAVLGMTHRTAADESRPNMARMESSETADLGRHGASVGEGGPERLGSACSVDRTEWVGGSPWGTQERSPVRIRRCPATVMPLRGTSQVACRRAVIGRLRRKGDRTDA